MLFKEKVVKNNEQNALCHKSMYESEYWITLGAAFVPAPATFAQKIAGRLLVLVSFPLTVTKHYRLTSNHLHPVNIVAHHFTWVCYNSSHT